jgi:carbon-monoxide dehydrogenase medium subunit
LKPVPFTYTAPESVDELRRIVAERDDASDTAILAGGQSLMPLAALRRVTPTTVVDINGLAHELGAIESRTGGLRLGALVRQRAAERDTTVAARIPLLAEALPLVAKPAIRTRGTIGGSVAYADPAAEIPLVAVALDAAIIASGPRGDRSISAQDFFVGPYANALAVDEFVSAVEFPDLPPGTGTCFLEVSPRYADRAIVAVAAAVTLDGGTVAQARLALGGVGATPMRAHRAEALLQGQAAEPEAIDAAAAMAAEGIDPDPDLRANAAYRRHVAGALSRRALTTAITRAGGAL